MAIGNCTVALPPIEKPESEKKYKVIPGKVEPGEEAHGDYVLFEDQPEDTEPKKDPVHPLVFSKLADLGIKKKMEAEIAKASATSSGTKENDKSKKPSNAAATSTFAAAIK